MIIGYYSQSFFGGGYYYKISKKNDDIKYKLEVLHSAIPNGIPNADQYIKEYETIEFNNEDIRMKTNMDSKLQVRYIDSNILINELIEYINSINLDKLSKNKYQNNSIMDGKNWSLYVEQLNKKYYIKGYEDEPKEVENIWMKLHQIVDQYIRNSLNGILGLAIGDAMGVPLEFMPREKLLEDPVTEMKEFGSHNMPKGTWSDDTSMTLATIDAIKSTGKMNYQDIADNFLKWFKEAEYTANHQVFDIGRTVLYALAKYEQNRNNPTDCGENSELSNGNGSLMRILPVAYYCYHKSSTFSRMTEDEVLEIVKDVSSITHRHEISILGCYIYTIYAIRLLYGDGKYSAYQYIQNLDYSMFTKNSINRYERILKNDISKLNIDEIKSTGYIVDTLEATIWVLLNTDNFNQAIIGAINLGNDTDTIGACTGGLAGIIYGVDEINPTWKDCLKRYEYIEKLCTKFDRKIFQTTQT